jgi:DNA recombination protein RmuC
MAEIVLVVLVVAVLALGGALLLRFLRGLLEERLGGIEERLERRLGDLDLRVDRRLESLDGRLLSTQQSAGETASQISEKLGRVEGATAQMLARANDLARLEQALRPPKARGGFGELLLANLLRDVLPADAYELQHGFAGGERVDAVIRIDKLVPVDAKFPLDNFLRLTDAGDETERALHAKAFARDVKSHIAAIAAKYIRPAEGTYDFALIYLPSESVYYELVSGTSVPGAAGDLYRYALEKRVFPVSPATFHAYLLVITLGLKGLQIEEHAREVMAYCAQLGKDFQRFREDFDLVGRHLGHAHSKHGEAERRLERFEARLERAVEAGEHGPVAAVVERRELDAA